MTTPDGSWRLEALCRTMDLDLFFPDSYDGIPPKARDACHACPVKRECLEVALRLGPMTSGIWAGTTQARRARIVKERRSDRARELEAEWHKSPRPAHRDPKPAPEETPIELEQILELCAGVAPRARDLPWRGSRP